MAEKTTIPTDTVELAERIFTATAASAGGRADRQVAIRALTSATVFRSAVAEMKLDDLTAAVKPVGPQLADCWCPNQAVGYPVNMVSRQKGDLAKVALIYAWLAKNVEPEQNVDQHVATFNRAFPGLAWSIAELRTARLVFPSYVVAA